MAFGDPTYHSAMPIAQNHAPHKWEYTDEAEREAAIGMVPSDIGKQALQLDDYSRWTLTDDSPVTWSPDSKGTGTTELNTALATTLLRTRLALSAAHTVVEANRGMMLDAITGTWTLTLTAAATLESGFAFAAYNSGTGVITIDANGTEEIRDQFGSTTTKTLAQGECLILQCTATGWIGTKFFLPRAVSIAYDPTVSLLTATDVQAAIDELKAIIGGGGGGSGTVTHTAGALTADAIVLGAGGDDVKVLASLGTATHVLTSNGPGVPPSFQAPSGGGGGGGGVGDMLYLFQNFH